MGSATPGDCSAGFAGRSSHLDFAGRAALDGPRATPSPVALGFLTFPSTAQVIVPPLPADRVTVSIEADITFDSAAGLYTYTYELSSAAISEQDVWFFAIEFDSELTNLAAPAGWSAKVHEDRPIVSWAAADTGPLPLGVDNGNIPPSPFSIVPGGTLGGFSFQSADPPANAVFYAQGDTPLAQVTTDVDELPAEGAEVLDFTANSFAGNSFSPRVVSGGEVFAGGRRPAIDGFLGFVNIEASRVTRSVPVVIIIRFSINGESVDTSTFSATLNNLDVTAMFVPNGNHNEFVGVFDLGSSPLVLGRNVLLTSVDGIIPGTTRTASDVDRLTLLVD